MDSYKVNELQKMLAHETSDSEEHYGARLSHWYGDTNHLTIDAGGIRALTPSSWGTMFPPITTSGTSAETWWTAISLCANWKPTSRSRAEGASGPTP